MTTPESSQFLNPYVGPRAFKYGEKLYGRDREVLALLDLLIAERVVLLYSPSGAGKSSLVQAGLIPELEQEGFTVLPVIRVNQDLPPNYNGNRYLYSTLLSLEEGQDEATQLKDAELVQLSLADYLTQREAALNNLEGLVLIFDQFEEILTLDPTNQVAKEAFFKSVGEALRQPHRWALFSLREDYLAGLDPYLRLIPTRLSTTFRLDLLGETAAREAIQKPAETVGVAFTDDAARKLVDNLRRVQVQQPDGSIEVRPGLYVEPVQLQVVCLDLWAKAATVKRIGAADIERVGDVDTALANYYAAQVRVIAADPKSQASERAIRDWCGNALISEQGIRRQVMRGVGASEGLANTAVMALVNAHLVRAEERRGITWYELAHDRLIKPVYDNNNAWEAANLSALQRQAVLWDEQHRPDGLLLRGDALAEAEQWADDHAEILTQAEKDLLVRSKEILEKEALRLEVTEAAARADEKSRAAASLHKRAIWMTVLAFVSVILAILAGVFGVSARQETSKAETANALALQQKSIAETERDKAETANALALQQKSIAETERDEARAAQAVADQARATLEKNLETASAQKGLSESERVAAEQQLAEVRATQTVVKQQQTFDEPTIDGYRLDWCYSPGGECGSRAATEWCKTQGFVGAIYFLDDLDVGQQGIPTKVLKTGDICVGEWCDSFKIITCIAIQSQPPQTFDEPTIDGYRLDWCYSFGGECGSRAATEWCKTQGFVGAIDFLDDLDVGRQGIRTKVLKTGDICVGEWCDSFKIITCIK